MQEWKRGEELSLLGFGLGRRREERNGDSRICGGDVVSRLQMVGFAMGKIC